MLIWLDGAFGSGKTTLMAALRGHLPDALVFDPEQVGALLTGIVDCPTGNFQDIPPRLPAGAVVLDALRPPAELAGQVLAVVGAAAGR
ncbi:hypothetical protein ACWERV_27505 [Streptomyces sp. NPDC004031]